MSSSVDNNHTDTTTTVNNEQKQQTDVNIKQVQSLLQIVQHSAAGPHIERTNILQMINNAANLSNLYTIRLDKLLYGCLNQLGQVTIYFIHAHIIQLVEAAAPQCSRQSTQHQSYIRNFTFIFCLTSLLFCRSLPPGPGP